MNTGFSVSLKNEGSTGLTEMMFIGILFRLTFEQVTLFKSYVQLPCRLEITEHIGIKQKSVT